MTTTVSPSTKIAEFSINKTWQADRRSPARWIASQAGRHKLLIVVVFIGAFINSIGAAILSIFIGDAFTVVTQEGSFNSATNFIYQVLNYWTGIKIELGNLSSLIIVVLLLIGSQILRGVFMLARNFASEIIGQRIERDSRDELYLSLIGKSMSFHDSQSTGDLMARATNDVREINYMFNPGINLVIGSMFFMITPFILVPGIHPQLILVPIAYALVYFFLLRDYLLKLSPATQTVRHEFGLLNATLAEAIDGIETVKGAAQEDKEITKFSKALNGWKIAFIKQGDIEALFYPVLLLGLLFAGGLIHSLYLFYTQQINLGNVVAFNGMLLMFGFPTFAAQFAYSHVSTGLSSAQRVLELINIETELDQNVGGHSGVMDGSIEFKNVSFSYNGSSNALEEVSFKAKPGQTIAIVGQTGSGKSTIAKLINRMYDINTGQIKIGNIDVRDWNLEDLRQQISIIEQDIFLFSRTVADNIAFGCPEANREEIIKAAKLAQAHNFISSFKDGYDTTIGERGVTLSGGQRQRLALARAFLTNPRILILDDSTSAIDSATEDRIQRAIEQAAKNRTTILITHRLSQIRWADLIVVLRQGRVARIGNHETLLAESKAYRNIFARYE